MSWVLSAILDGLPSVLLRLALGLSSSCPHHHRDQNKRKKRPPRASWIIAQERKQFFLLQTHIILTRIFLFDTLNTLSRVPSKCRLVSSAFSQATRCQNKKWAAAKLQKHKCEIIVYSLAWSIPSWNENEGSSHQIRLFGSWPNITAKAAVKRGGKRPSSENIKTRFIIKSKARICLANDRVRCLLCRRRHKCHRAFVIPRFSRSGLFMTQPRICIVRIRSIIRVNLKQNEWILLIDRGRK